MKTLIIGLISGVVLLAQTPPAKAPAAKTPAKAPARSAAPKAAPTNPALLNPAALRARAPELFRVKFVTTHGDFVVEVHRDWAPLGADRFYNLVRNRFFSDASFFRYVPGFIVQFGISPDPRVTAAWSKATIKDDPVKEHNVKGSVVFAMGGPNTRTTQFFINLRDNSASLDSQGFAPFGTVTEGMDVVEGLYSGYGDMAEMGGRGPSQQLLSEQGKPYLDKNFPRLDSIRSATVIFPEPAAPPAKKAAPAAKKSASPAPPAKK
jgi:peptidyl-prolyl cis-trans isomerase A (cyclophilin A)